MKSFAINWAPSSTSSRWVSSLNHKIGNNSVENQSVVISSPTQFCEIPARVRRMIPIQFDGDGPHGRFHVDEWRLPIFWRNPGHLEIKHFFTFSLFGVYQWRKYNVIIRGPRTGLNRPGIPERDRKDIVAEVQLWRAVGDIWKQSLDCHTITVTVELLQ